MSVVAERRRRKGQPASRIPLLALRAWMKAGSHASPKRQREETATGIVRQPAFPCLRCGLWWPGDARRVDVMARAAVGAEPPRRVDEPAGQRAGLLAVQAGQRGLRAELQAGSDVPY